MMPLGVLDTPDDTATDTFDRSVGLIDGVPTVIWATRPWTAEELANETAEVNRQTIEDQALIALINNRAFIDLASPTNAQAVIQIKSLSRQNNSIIRLLVNRLEGTD